MSNERKEKQLDMLEDQLSDLLMADNATMEMMLASGQIDAIADTIYGYDSYKNQMAEFKADGLSREDVKEKLDEMRSIVNDLLHAAREEGENSPQKRLVEKLMIPAVTFLEEIYENYLLEDCIIHIELMPDKGQLPTRAHEADAGMDVYSADEGILDPGQVVAIGTGLKAAIPVGWQLSVRPRSGLSMKGLTIVNSPGTIDANYHDEVKILIKNNGTQPYTIMKGDRIAQFVLEKVYTPKWEIVENLEKVISESRINEKGEQGFGSTGR